MQDMGYKLRVDFNKFREHIKINFSEQLLHDFN